MEKSGIHDILLYAAEAKHCSKKGANKIDKMSEERNYFVTLQRKNRLPWGVRQFCPSVQQAMNALPHSQRELYMTVEVRRSFNHIHCNYLFYCNLQQIAGLELKCFAEVWRIQKNILCNPFLATICHLPLPDGGRSCSGLSCATSKGRTPNFPPTRCWARWEWRCSRRWYGK